MPTEDQMTGQERRSYLKRMKVRYLKVNRRERGQLLEEMEQMTGMHRKSLIRLLTGPSLDQKKRYGKRERSYGAEVEEVIVCVWESLDAICAERLTPVLPSMAQHLARFGVLKLSEEIEEQLKTISRATVSRILARYRSRRRRLPQKGAERANQVTKGVPMGRIAWDMSEPGHCEVDLVYHSGSSVMGEHIHTIQLVDVATGWSERVAVMGRGYQGMQVGFERIVERIPFAIVELHPDNGSEFFNHHLVRFWKEKIVGVQLSRSRPYQKNDNRIVEQKNDTLVRQYFGDLRFDRPEHLEAMNALYEQMWLYYNLFQPVMHLKEKIAVGDRVRRKWDEAQTPFERMKASGKLKEERQVQLQALYEQTNPKQLREEIYQGLAHLWEQSQATTTQVA